MIFIPSAESCEICWDYHCPECIPPSCAEKLAKLEAKRDAERRREREEREALDRERWKARNEESYRKHLAAQGGLTDFEKIWKEKLQQT